MPRKDFLQDLEQAAAPGCFYSLTTIRAGEYEGSISFTFTQIDKSLAFDLQAIVSDSHDYPREHSFLVFVESESCPPAVNAALEAAVSFFTGSSIHELLTSVTDIITSAISDSDSDSDSGSASFVVEGNTPDFNDCESVKSDDESDWDRDEEGGIHGPFESETELLEMIRRDLRAVKTAGFKTGYLGLEKGTIIVSVSCRIAKLGISDEAMDAWNVKPSEYFVLLIRYVPNYVDLQRVLEIAGDAKKIYVQMRVGLCDSYKPSLQCAIAAFQDAQDHDLKEKSTRSDTETAGHPLKPLFIGKSLDSLLKERLFGIVRLRLQHGFSWTGAELFFHTSQGKSLESCDTSSQEYYQPDSWATSAPELLVSDHVAEMNRKIQNISLPLLAMQFTLRHFVKCTEFCLVCYCKTNDTFEALKPYVCSSGLCLYQYMALAMGPSLEYEILSQPLVVELLISLAYASAASGQLKDFPTGLGLRVPAALLQPDPGSNAFHTGQLDTARLELRTGVLPVRIGDYIVIRPVSVPFFTGELNEWHCRVDLMSETPGHIILSFPTCQGQQLRPGDFAHELKEVEFAIYDTNLDDLTILQTQRMISIILSTLPDVQGMKKFIINGGQGELLSKWKARISPAALDLLRWVVASNRSFIKQDDQTTAHQVSGMMKFVQFRLVQGAADKEQRFTDAVNSHSLTKNANHPTLFAWHGSPVYNWHSILRQGLNYETIANGRAHGNGVYMSRSFQTSMGYTSRHCSVWWPENRLKIKTAISLNEIVNSPEKFQCTDPHYVVQYLDWVQPRYLFVQLNKTSAGLDHALQCPDECKEQVPLYEQDERHIAYGPGEIPINIPISILSGQRGKTLRAKIKLNRGEDGSSPKRRKIQQDMDGMQESDDNLSIETDVEDFRLLLSDDENPRSHTKTTVQEKVEPKTDHITEYQPGTLSENCLPMLSPPKYASTPATKILQQHLTATLKIQNQIPLQDLGWYVDHSLITTVYQWIVELHSFDQTLPLAQDLKTANMQSIVLELRFPPQFPMDPPFVRVLRPRFLEFALGGGGHVTAGGAMCMELLTQSGWLPTASIESVLLQVRMAILNPDPRPARLNLQTSKRDYSVGEAVEAYRRVSAAHGWQISKDVQELAW